MRLGDASELGPTGWRRHERSVRRLVSHGKPPDRATRPRHPSPPQLTAATPSGEIVNIEPASAGGFIAALRTA